MELPDAIAAFDCEVGVFAGVKQPVMLVSVGGHRNLRERYMVIASVCWFCAIILMLLTALEAISRHEGEVYKRLKVVISKCVVARWLSFVNDFVRII